MGRESWISRTPLFVAFTVLDPVLDGLGGREAASALFSRRLEEGLSLIASGFVYGTESGAVVFVAEGGAVPPFDRVTIALVEAPRLHGRSQWQVFSVFEPPFEAANPGEQSHMARLHAAITSWIVAWPETEDVDASGAIGLMPEEARLYGLLPRE